MVWVRSEYAGELAVLSAWVAALLPWNIMYNPNIEGLGGSTLFIRWPFLQIRYIFDVEIAEAVSVSLPTGALDLVTGPVTLAYELWLAGAVLFALAVLLSVVMYVVDGLVEQAVPNRTVRRLGELLAGGSVVIAGVVIFSGQGVLYVWLAATVLVTGAVLFWLDQTAEDGRPDAAGEQDDEDDVNAMSATDGGVAAGEAGLSITTRTATLVGIGSITLSACATFVTITMVRVSWPAGWLALAGLTVPAIVNKLLALGVVAALTVGVLRLGTELLEREQPALTVRAMGVLLGSSSLVLAGSTIVFIQRDEFGGFPIPLGMVVLLALAGVLLTVDLE